MTKMALYRRALAGIIPYLTGPLPLFYYTQLNSLRNSLIAGVYIEFK